MRPFAGPRSVVWVAALVSIAACLRREQAASPSAIVATSGDAGLSAMRGACAPTVVAAVPWPVTALFVWGERVYGISRESGAVFAFSTSDGSVKTLSSSEREPFAIGVRGGQPVWASSEGVFGSNEDGTNRRVLVSDGGVNTLATAADGVYFTTQSGHLWRADWPQTFAAEDVNKRDDVDLATARELVIVGGWLVYLDRSDVYAYELAAGRTRTIGGCPGGLCQRKPHDLSASGDGKSLVWHEGEADLMAGRSPRAFSATVGTWSLAELPGDYESFNQYIVRDRCTYGPATFKRTGEREWSRLDTGAGMAPIADDAARWYWTESTADGHSRIMAATKAGCCH